MKNVIAAVFISIGLVGKSHALIQYLEPLNWGIVSHNSFANFNKQTYFINDMIRNYFIFDLSRIEGRINSASFELTRGNIGDHGKNSIIFSMYHVETSPELLSTKFTKDSIGGFDAFYKIFDDLKNGPIYGNNFLSQTGNPSDILSFSLNEKALADMNSSGKIFTIGGAAPVGFALFGDITNPTIRLAVEADAPVPEPSTLLLLGMGVAAIGFRKYH